MQQASEMPFVKLDDVVASLSSRNPKSYCVRLLNGSISAPDLAGWRTVATALVSSLNCASGFVRPLGLNSPAFANATT